MGGVEVAFGTIFRGEIEGAASSANFTKCRGSTDL
jgi:hypothetical protein